MPKLKNSKREEFARQYIIDRNATQAAIRAKYSKKTAKSQGQRLLTNADVNERINELLADRAKRTEIDADYVLNRLAEIDQMDARDILDDNGNIKPLSQWPKVWSQYITSIKNTEIFEGSGGDRNLAGILKEVKWPDKLKNLELLGKHVKVQAFKEKVEHDASENMQDMMREFFDMKSTTGLPSEREK